MAAVVESTSTVTTLTARPLVLTKPTGLAVGDMLLAFVVQNAGSSATLSTPSGWTAVLANDQDSDTKTSGAAFAKIADAGDVAASDFSFTTNNASSLMGVLYRISGHAGISSIANAVTYAPPGNSSLVFIFAYAGDNDGSSTSWSGYSITGGATPTFTERIDTSAVVNASIAVADGLYSSNSSITAFDVNGGAGMDGTRKRFLAIPSQEDGVGTNALLESEPEFFNNTGVDVGGNGTNALLEVQPEFFDQNGNATSRTVWVNEPKPSTSWNNETL